MTTPVRARVREEDYLATMTGEKPSLEYVNGEVYQKPLVKKPHADIAKAVARRFLAYEEEHGGYFAWEATTNFSVGSQRRYRVPDLAYWSPGRPVAQQDDVYLPPTVAVEIRSQGQTFDELIAKCREYRQVGVEACWLIDPLSRAAYIFDYDNDGARVPSGGILSARPVPGFELPIDDLWSLMEATG